MATTKQQLAKLTKLAEQHRVAVYKAQQIQEQRDDLIVELLDGGQITSSVIAAHAGTSQPRVIQIRSRARLRNAPEVESVEVVTEPLFAEAASA